VSEAEKSGSEPAAVKEQAGHEDFRNVIRAGGKWPDQWQTVIRI
jgi:hypothetical protein